MQQAHRRHVLRQPRRLHLLRHQLPLHLQVHPFRNSPQKQSPQQQQQQAKLTAPQPCCQHSMLGQCWRLLQLVVLLLSLLPIWQQLAALLLPQLLTRTTQLKQNPALPAANHTLPQQQQLQQLHTRATAQAQLLDSTCRVTSGAGTHQHKQLLVLPLLLLLMSASVHHNQQQQPPRWSALLPRCLTKTAPAIWEVIGELAWQCGAVSYTAVLLLGQNWPQPQQQCHQLMH